MRICFVVDMPTGRDGAELQCYMIAKGLLSKGWNVSYITLHKPLREEKSFPVYQAKAVTQGEGWLARYSRFLSLLRHLRVVNPDIVFVTHGGALSGFVALYAVVHRKTIVFRAAMRMDADFTFRRSVDFPAFSIVARLLHLLTVMKAEAIVANAEDVARAFSKRFPSKNVHVIRNGLRIVALKRQKPTHVLWIGKLIDVKNPYDFVRLAKGLPDIKFVMSGTGSLWDTIVEQSSALPNFTLIRGDDEDAKTRLLERSFAFVSTSLSESFPNTLIEAGIYGIPYISFVDPDEVICRFGLGFHVGSFGELVEMTRTVVSNRELRTRVSANIRSYVEKNHDLSNTVSNYDELLRQLLIR
jgi:glycosyltransferase involved in cell wall biosynthesis